MSEKEDYVEVTIQVPKRFIQLLEEQHYFGLNKQEFFSNA